MKAVDPSSFLMKEIIMSLYETLGMLVLIMAAGAYVMYFVFRNEANGGCQCHDCQSHRDDKRYL